MIQQNLKNISNRFWMVREMLERLKIDDKVLVIGNLEVDEDQPYHFIQLGSVGRVLGFNSMETMIDVIGQSCDGLVITQVISARDIELIGD